MKIECHARIGRFSYLRLFAGRAEYWRTLFDGPARVTVPFPERADLAGGKFRVILDREELRAIGTVTSKGEPPCP